jgi:hypothetical protein
MTCGSMDITCGSTNLISDSTDADVACLLDHIDVDVVGLLGS